MQHAHNDIKLLKSWIICDNPRYNQHFDQYLLWFSEYLRFES